MRAFRLRRECYREGLNEPLAVRGSLQSCNELGMMYFLGRGVAQSDSLAAQAYRRACDGGNAEGCGSLGLMYGHGLGVPQNDSLAAQLDRRACDGGFYTSCIPLGTYYEEGRGVAQSDSLAAQAYRRACDSAVYLGCLRVGVMYLEGRGVPASDTLAAQSFRLACDHREPSGTGPLQDSCEYLDVMQNNRARIRELQRLCERPQEWACRILRTVANRRRAPQ